MRKHILDLAAAGLLFLVSASGANAQATMTSSSNVQPIVLPEFNVVAPTPIPGSEVDRSQIPANDIRPQLRRYLLRAACRPSRTPSPVKSRAQESATFKAMNTEPDIIYHGFIASPVAGTAQGLAVYVNGARFNDPFGDTVNWDLIPAIAIQSVTVEILKSAVRLERTWRFGQRAIEKRFQFSRRQCLKLWAALMVTSGSKLEYGKQVGDYAVYGAGEYLSDRGFQPTGKAQIERAYLDLGLASVPGPKRI